jgi:putative transposase
MLVAERHIIKKGHRFWAEIDNLSWQSKNLYNSANYLIRQNFIYGHGYLTYNQMASLMKKTEQYQALPAKVSQQVLRGLDWNWPSFFADSSFDYTFTNYLSTRIGLSGRNTLSRSPCFSGELILGGRIAKNQ